MHEIGGWMGGTVGGCIIVRPKHKYHDKYYNLVINGLCYLFWFNRGVAVKILKVNDMLQSLHNFAMPLVTLTIDLICYKLFNLLLLVGVSASKTNSVNKFTSISFYPLTTQPSIHSVLLLPPFLFYLLILRERKTTISCLHLTSIQYGKLYTQQTTFYSKHNLLSIL